jgi:peroxiredoxin
MARFLRFSTIVLSVALLTFALFGCGGGEGEPQTGEGETQSAAEQQSSQMEQRAAGTGTDVGQSPPDFTLPDLNGNDVSLSDFEGKVVILDLWATWCPPCRQEIPFLASLYEEYRDRGLEIVGVGLDRGGASVLAPFVEANKVTYTILVGNEAVSRQYNVTSIPMTLTIDRDGLVASRDVGFAPSMEAEMRARVEELLARPATEA